MTEPVHLQREHRECSDSGELYPEEYAPSKVHILVVDDDKTTLTILRTVLKKYSYQVTVVESGTEAWNQLNSPNTKFDLVLTDVMMPGVSGFSLVQMIKENSNLQEIPVILMSGDSKMANDSIKYGGHDYVMKPIGPEILRKKVDTVMHNIWRKRNETEYRSVLAKERAKAARVMEEKESEIDKLKKKVSEMTSASNEALELPLQAITSGIEKLLEEQSWTVDSDVIKLQLKTILKELGSANLFRPQFDKIISNDRVDSVTKSYLVSEFSGPSAVRRNSIPTFPKTIRQDSKEGIKSWDFDVTRYTNSEHELMPMIVDMFDNFQLLDTFQIPLKKLQRFIMTVYSFYRKTNGYHNFIHAFDVTQTVYSFLTQMNAQVYLTHLDVLALLISSLCHDLDHPGFNNAFQIQAQSDLALNYNDVSVLENHHASLTFRVLKHSECNILEALDDDQKKEIRRSIISMILATDMANHFEHVGKFKHHLQTQKFDRNKKEDRQMILNYIIKCSDTSNVAKPWPVSEIWSNRLADEFFNQTDFEKKNNYVVAPHMDPAKTTRPKIPADFIDFVASPLYVLLQEFLPEASIVLDHITINRQNWQKRLDDMANGIPYEPPPYKQQQDGIEAPNGTVTGNGNGAAAVNINITSNNNNVSINPQPVSAASTS